MAPGWWWRRPLRLLLKSLYPIAWALDGVVWAGWWAATGAAALIVFYVDYCADLLWRVRSDA